MVQIPFLFLFILYLNTFFADIWDATCLLWIVVLQDSTVAEQHSFHIWAVSAFSTWCLYIPSAVLCALKFKFLLQVVIYLVPLLTRPSKCGPCRYNFVKIFYVDQKFLLFVLNPIKLTFGYHDIFSCLSYHHMIQL